MAKKPITINWKYILKHGDLSIRDSDGHPVARIYGTKGDDIFKFDLRADQVPVGKEWLLGYDVSVFGGPGNDRMTSEIGTSSYSGPVTVRGKVYEMDMKLGYYGRSGDGTVGGSPFPDPKVDGSHNLIQAGAGAHVVIGKGTVDLHGLGATYKNNAPILRMDLEGEDRLELPADRGLDVTSVRFAGIRPDQDKRGFYGLVDRWTATADDSNPLLDGFEIDVRVPTSHATGDVAAPTWLWIGKGTQAERMDAMQAHVNDMMAGDGVGRDKYGVDHYDQSIFG